MYSTHSLRSTSIGMRRNKEVGQPDEAEEMHQPKPSMPSSVMKPAINA